MLHWGPRGQAQGAPRGAAWAGPGRAEQGKMAKAQSGRQGWQGRAAQTFRLWILALILDSPAQM